MSVMSNLSTGIDEEIATHLRGQAEAHVAIAAVLVMRAQFRNDARAAIALTRASAHAEIAYRYTVLAPRVETGAIDYADENAGAVTTR